MSKECECGWLLLDTNLSILCRSSVLHRYCHWNVIYCVCSEVVEVWDSSCWEKQIVFWSSVLRPFVRASIVSTRYFLPSSPLLLINPWVMNPKKLKIAFYWRPQRHHRRHTTPISFKVHRATKSPSRKSPWETTGLVVGPWSGYVFFR